MKRWMIAVLCASASLAWGQGLREKTATLSAAPKAEDAVKPKENSIAVGLTLTDGNSDTLTGTLGLLHDRVRECYSLRLSLDGAYAEDEEDTTAENARGVADYRRPLRGTPWYAFGNASALYDGMADIDYRFVLSGGPGVNLLQNEKSTISADLGPAFITEKVAGDTDSAWALRIGQRWDARLSPTARFWQAAEYLPAFDDWDDYLFNVEAGIEAAINSSFSLRLILRDSYDSQPAPDREKNDLAVIGAVVYLL